MLDFDLKNLDTQRIGRMGELVVELELLARGWRVGNFNATTMNSAGWDLFAVRDGVRPVKIRVKAKRPGTPSFLWTQKKDGSVFPDLDSSVDDDFVAAVSFHASGAPDIYVLPSAQVQQDLLDSTAAWLAGEKKRGTGNRKPTTALRVAIDHQTSEPGRGFATHWENYLDGWHILLRG